MNKMKCIATLLPILPAKSRPTDYSRLENFSGDRMTMTYLLLNAKFTIKYKPFHPITMRRTFDQKCSLSFASRSDHTNATSDQNSC